MKCWNCGSQVKYKHEDVILDCKGTYGDTKYVYCPECKKINIVGYHFEPNRESWFYDYSRKEESNGIQKATY